MLIRLEGKGRIEKVANDMYTLAAPSFIDVVNQIANERFREVLVHRFSGKTLEYIAEIYDVTRERVR